jgi:preflagellin peptidase FlaK
VIGAIGLAVIDLILYCPNLVAVYGTNILTIAIVSIALYAVGVWTAGDSKLLIVLILCAPAQLLAGNLACAPMLITLPIIFSLAFLYIVASSLYGFIARHEKPQFAFKSIKPRQFVGQWARCALFSLLFSALRVIPTLQPMFQNNVILVMLINLFIILLAVNFKFFKRKLVIGIAAILLLTAAVINPVALFVFNWHVYIIAIVVIFVRMMVDQDNYQEVETAQIQEGMVLPAISILKLRARGLSLAVAQPSLSAVTEYRLSSQDAIDIREFSEKRRAPSSIAVSRKMPFAVFVGLGVVIYIVAQGVIGGALFN